MIKRDWDLLFSEYDLRRVLEHQLSEVPNKIRAMPRGRFEELTDDFLAAEVASDLVVSPLELHLDQVEVSPPKDVEVDVTHDPNRVFFGPGPHYVHGLEVTYHLPYAGDMELFKCRPNQYTLNPPRAVIDRKELRFPYDRANKDVASTKPEFDRDVETIVRWIGWVNAQIDDFNKSLEQKAKKAVAERRGELDSAKSGMEEIGLPIRGEKQGETGVAQSKEELQKRRTAKRRAEGRQYDVALSFAGEDRGYVEAVATVLQEIGVEVFYDRFETVELWGKDLAEHLGNVYSERSHFVVMFASRHYAEKAWPSHERQHALARHLGGDQGRILPVRIDDTKIPGLPGTIAYLDARVLEPAKLSELIRQKLDLEL